MVLKGALAFMQHFKCVNSQICEFVVSFFDVTNRLKIRICSSGFVKTCDELVNSHDDPETAAAKENINVRAAFIHVIGDFLQSLGVFIAALVIYFKPNWVIIDPICTFVFSVLVLFTTVKILQDTMRVLMEGEQFFDRELWSGLSMSFFLQIDIFTNFNCFRYF